MYVHVYRGYEYIGMAFVTEEQKRRLEANGYEVVITTAPHNLVIQ